MERDRWIADVAMLLRGALEKKLVKSRSSGCRNWEASIPLRILVLLSGCLVAVAVVADGVDNAPMPFGRSKSREMIVLFIFCVLFY